MKYQAEFLLLKNKLRLMKGTIRHTWQGLVGVIAAGGVLLYQFFSVVPKTGNGAEVPSQGVFYVFSILAAVNLFRVFINQTPVFRMESASVIYIYNTGYFRKSLLLKQLVSVLSAIPVSGLLACASRGFLFDFVFLRLWLLIALYIGNCSFLSWIFYHTNGRIRWIAGIVFSFCTVMLFLQSLSAVVVLAVSLGAVWIYAQRFLRLNLTKYHDRIHSLEAASVAVSRNDFARMQQLAEENRPSYVSNPMLHHLKPKKKTALWLKSLLELFRMQKQAVVILLLLLLGGWVVSRTGFLSFLPLLDDPMATGIIAVLCTTSALSAMYQLLIRQAKTVSDKRKLGLTIPFSTRQIIVSYGLTAILLNLIITLMIGLLYEVFSIRLVLLLFSELISYSASCCSQLFDVKSKRLVPAFSNIVLFSGVYCLLML